MDQHDDRLSRIRRESELSSNLDCALSNGSRAEIDEILRDDTAHDLKRTFGKDECTVYHVILKNDKLTEEDIIAISKIFRWRGVNPHARNREYNAIGPVHYAIRNRMRNVTDFFMRCRRPSYVLNTTLTKFFVEDENDKFWSQAKENYNKNELWNSEQIEIESVDFLEWLISRESNFERGNDQWVSSTDAAIRYNLQHLLPVLLSRSSEPAIYQVDYLRRFLDNNKSARKDHRYSRSKLWYSSYSSRYAAKIVKILLEKGAAIPDYWTKYIQFAIKGSEDIRIIRMLVDHFPSDCDESNVATTLLQQLMNYPVVDLTASEIDCYRQIRSDLAAKGADIEKKNDNEMTPIQVAVDQKNMHAAIWLSEIGANFDVLSRNARNLLHLLVTEQWVVQKRKENVRKAIFDILVSKGCQVNARDSNGVSPLHLAAQCRDMLMARGLIEHGADVNCKDEDMWTPLHYAGIEPEAVEMIELLLENGANVNVKDIKGESFFSQAFLFSGYYGDFRVLKVLMKWGAQVNALYGFDGKKLMRQAEKVDVDTFREFLKYGLDVNDSSFCNILYGRRRAGIETLMEQHCVKLHCAQDYSAPSNSNYECQRHYEECLKEIEMLKATFINSRISLYDFLRMNLGCKCMHINNESLKAVVDSPILEKQFPLYSFIILTDYREAVARKSLLEPAKAAWLELTEIGLPDVCIELVLSYLSNVDLVNMIEP